MSNADNGMEGEAWGPAGDCVKEEPMALPTALTLCIALSIS